MSSRAKGGICFCLIFSKKQQMLRCAQHDSCLGECPPKGGRYELRKLHLLGGHLGQHKQAVLDLEAFNLSVPQFLAEAHEGHPRGMFRSREAEGTGRPVTELPVAWQLAAPGSPSFLFL